MSKQRKSRAKWQRGIAFEGLLGLLSYVRDWQSAGMRRQDIMVYCPWSRGVRRHDERPVVHVDRPTSITVLFNMSLSLVESMCVRGVIYRAHRRENA